MYLRIFRAMWFLSLFAFFVTLLYAYASLQERVMLPYSSNGSSVLIAFSRDAFFYSLLGFATFINGLVFIIRALLKQKEHEPFKTWFHGFVITLHIFLIIAISFVGVVNSGERFNYISIGIIIYSAVGLVMIWALCWPLYLILAKFYNKQTV